MNTDTNLTPFGIPLNAVCQREGMKHGVLIENGKPTDLCIIVNLTPLTVRCAKCVEEDKRKRNDG